MSDLKNNSEQITLLEAKNWGDDHNGETVDLVGEGRKCLIIVNVGSTSTTTVAITIQQKATSGASWTTLKAITETTTEGVIPGSSVFDLTPTGRYIRAICTIGTKESGLTVVSFYVGAILYDLRYVPENIS